MVPSPVRRWRSDARGCWASGDSRRTDYLVFQSQTPNAFTVTLASLSTDGAPPPLAVVRERATARSRRSGPVLSGREGGHRVTEAQRKKLEKKPKQKLVFVFSAFPLWLCVSVANYRAVGAAGRSPRLALVDVVVIGGGPAGSTCSTLLTQHGCRVELFEREKFPRFHIGESLIPETYWVLQRLDMLPKMQKSHFVKKYSVQFVNADGRLSAPFYFWDNKPHECSQTWQVERSEFDQMMLENAREHGAEIVFLSAAGERVARLYEALGFRRVGTACFAFPGDA